MKMLKKYPPLLQKFHKSISNFTFAVLQQAYLSIGLPLLKSNPIWTSKYSAIEWTLHLGYFATPFGTWFVVAMKSYLKPLTQFVLLLELYGPLLMLVPFATKYIRTTAMFLLIGMHLNLYSLCIGLFPIHLHLFFAFVLPNRIVGLASIKRKSN